MRVCVCVRVCAWLSGYLNGFRSSDRIVCVELGQCVCVRRELREEENLLFRIEGRGVRLQEVTTNKCSLDRLKEKNNPGCAVDSRRS